MADPEVKPEEPAKPAGDKKIGPESKGKGSFVEKHKPWLYGGVAIVLVIIFLLMRHSSSSASSTPSTTAANSGIDPSTGYLYGSPADIAAQGGSGTTSTIPGPAGSTGATGATGATGPAGAAGKAATPGTTTTSKSGTTSTQTYTVKPGDTLASIAAKFGVSVAALAHGNTYVKGEASAAKVGTPLGTGAGLKTGQTLKVP